MKDAAVNIIALFVVAVACLAGAGPPLYARNDSAGATHEMPPADKCSVIILHIRELVSSLKQVNRAISRLEPPLRPAAVGSNNGAYEQKMHDYKQKHKALLDQELSLRKQVDLKEQQLGNCLSHESPSEQKATEKAQMK